MSDVRRDVLFASSPHSRLARFMMSSQISPVSIQQTLSENLEAIVECFNRCFETQLELSPGEAKPWSDALGVSTMAEAGLSVLLEMQGAWLQVLIPESLPLPTWYVAPNASQTSRLDTLGMEWASLIIPQDLQGGGYSTTPHANLLLAMQAADPHDDGFWIPVDVLDQGSPAAQIQFIFPVRGETAPAPAAVADFEQFTPPANSAPRKTDRIKRLMPLSVPVSVRLAEKRITLGQLVNIGPGGLITFPKSCEDLLDLYVNNQLYAKGEAVKIGEKFGLKINEVGAENPRVSGVFTL
jgi:flagellar motor switch protein FliN/FliY